MNKVIFLILLLPFVFFSSAISEDAPKIGEVTSSGPVLTRSLNELKAAYDQFLNDGTITYNVYVIEPSPNVYWLMGNGLRNNQECTFGFPLVKDANGILREYIAFQPPFPREINVCDGCTAPCSLVWDGNGDFDGCSNCTGGGFCNHTVIVVDDPFSRGLQ